MSEESRDSALDEVKEQIVDEETKLAIVVETTSHPENHVESPIATEVEEPSKNGDSIGTKSTSDKVQEGQKWDNRNRGNRDFKKNVKSDLTSQEESSDPVAIRKQVRRPPFL